MPPRKNSVKGLPGYAGRCPIRSGVKTTPHRGTPEADSVPEKGKTTGRGTLKAVFVPGTTSSATTGCL